MPKVLISDKLSPKAAEIFRDRGIAVDFRPGLAGDELLVAIRDVDGLAIRSATTVTADLMDAAKNLKVVGRAGIGVDNVDVSEDLRSLRPLVGRARGSTAKNFRFIGS